MRRNSAHALAAAVAAGGLASRVDGGAWQDMARYDKLQSLDWCWKKLKVWPEELWPKVLPRLERTLPEAWLGCTLCMLLWWLSGCRLALKQLKQTAARALACKCAISLRRL